MSVSQQRAAMSRALLVKLRPLRDRAALYTAVQAKCQEMQRKADDAATSLRNEYTIQLMKLPKKVRRDVQIVGGARFVCSY